MIIPLASPPLHHSLRSLSTAAACTRYQPTRYQPTFLQDAFIAGSVPIVLGSPTVPQSLPMLCALCLCHVPSSM